MFSLLFGNRETVAALHRSQAVIEFKPNGKILRANQNFLKTLGYSRGEIVGKHHRIFVDPTYAESAAYPEFWKALHNGQFQCGEFERFGKHGQSVWIQATYNPVFNCFGRVKKIVKFATDITQQKTIQAEIQNRSQAVIEFLPDGTILTANERFIETMGYSLDEIKGLHHRIFLTPEERDSADYQSFWRRLAAGEFRQGEFHRIKKDGNEIWLQGAYNPVFNHDGVVTKVVKGVTDITAAVKSKRRSQAVGTEMAQSVSDMSEAISEIASVVSRTACLAENADVTARAAGDSVDELNASSADINRVLNLIQGLADQTNLLALNATIEAARAGEAGKGFAVVAGEVKSLACETANATDEIRSRISAIQSNIADVVDAIKNILGGISEVSNNTSSVAAAVEEQSVVMTGMNMTAKEILEISA